MHSLVIPGGVVANTVGLTVESSLQMVANARQAWRWDAQSPDRLFGERGVDADSLPDFPFRDDTLLLWQAIKRFVRDYLAVYYTSAADVSADSELQGFINELMSPRFAAFQGLDGLTQTNDDNQPYRIESFDYLVEVVAHIIYIAGPLHASVNYAQYPLMSFAPSVSGCIYHAPPTRSTVIANEDESVAWYLGPVPCCFSREGKHGVITLACSRKSTGHTSTPVTG